MILQTILPGAYVVDRHDTRHIGRVVTVKAGFVPVRWIESGWLGTIADRDAIPVSDGVADDARHLETRRALMLAEVIR
jgi:hypothetical protein